MPLGKGRHPLWRDRKDSLSQANSSTATPCYFFTLSEERVHCRSPGFHKHGLPLLPPMQVPHTFINRIEEWGIYPHEKWENIILQYRHLPGFLQAPGKAVLYLL